LPGAEIIVARRRAILATRLLRGVDAWAKLRNFSTIIIPVPGNFTHPTLIGFMESML
jgi:hypothetical protein